MNYYERHIGDYLKDTAHLSLLEHGVYSRLLDVYYTREGAIPVAQVERLVAARSKEERAALAVVLDEFFTVSDDVLHHARCDREIERYQAKAERNRVVGKLGGRPRKTQTQSEPTNNPDGFQTEPTQNPSQYPVTSNQRKDKEIAPSELAEPPPKGADPPPPPPFDGNNAKALNGKCVVSLSPGWELPEDWGVDAEALGWQPKEVLYEAEKFRQYWTAGKGIGTRRAVKGWRQSWSNWLGKAAERKLR